MNSLQVTSHIIAENTLVSESHLKRQVKVDIEPPSKPPSRDSFAATMEDSTGENQNDSDRHLNVIMMAIFFLLCSMIASFGPMIYFLVYNAEIKRYATTFRSISDLMSRSVSGSIQRKIDAGNFVNNMFAGEIHADKKQSMPNFTTATFENTIKPLVEVANCRYMTFAPLVDNTTRDGWEAYAAKKWPTFTWQIY